MTTNTATGLMTADELMALHEPGVRHELVRGELRRMPPAGFEHGDIAWMISYLLGLVVVPNRLGKIVAAETGFRLESDPDTVRAADCAFIRRERLRPEWNRRKHLPIAPDLVVEVTSPSDSDGSVEEKCRAWLGYGAALVWEINPRRRTVTVRRNGAENVTLAGTDTLDGGEVVPGFRCRVADIFGEV
jgi:Uma2 family endonuclease